MNGTKTEIIRSDTCEDTYRGIYKPKAVGRSFTFTDMCIYIDKHIYSLVENKLDPKWHLIMNYLEQIGEMLAKKRCFFLANWSKYKEFATWCASKYITRVTSPKHNLFKDDGVTPKLSKIKSVLNFYKQKLFFWKSEWEHEQVSDDGWYVSLDESAFSDGAPMTLVEMLPSIITHTTGNQFILENLWTVIEDLSHLVRNSFYSEEIKERLHVVALQTLCNMFDARCKIINYKEKMIAGIYVERAIKRFIEDVENF